MVLFYSISGAGKTTLLNIITHRRSGKLKVSADVRINGRKMKRDISGISAFVQQEELFIGSLTVREHLRFHVCIHFNCIKTISFRCSRPCFVSEKNLPKMNEKIVSMKSFILYVILFAAHFQYFDILAEFNQSREYNDWYHGHRERFVRW